MKHLRRLSAFIIAITMVCLCAYCEGAVSCTLADDCFVKSGEGDLYVRADDTVSDISIRTGNGKTVKPDENGHCRIPVTKDDLANGSVTIQIKYKRGGNEIAEQITLPVHLVEDVCKGTLYIVFPDRALLEGETVPVRYELVNTGKIRFDSAVLRTGDGTEKAFTDIPANTSVSFTEYVTVEKGSQYSLSADVVSPYSGKTTQIASVTRNADIARDEVVLTAVCEPSAAEGTSARMTLNIENRGTASYHGCGLYLDGSYIPCDLPDTIESGDFVSVNINTPLIEKDTAFRYELRLVCADGSVKTVPAAEVAVKAEPAGDIAVQTNEPEDVTPENTAIRDIILLLSSLKGFERVILLICGGAAIVLATVIMSRRGKKSAKEKD